jgi:cation:H+ antiporter
MLDFTQFAVPVNIAAFAAGAAAIAIAGVRLAGVADALADRTGLGEALAGAIFLGASTSLPGIVTSVTAAWNGHPELAASNAVGGIAVQTAFLAIADITYKKANLEHAAASTPNVMQAAVLVSILAIPLLAASTHNVSVWGVHPATPLLFAAYFYGMKMVKEASERPLWRPRRTRDTREDQPDGAHTTGSLRRLWMSFAMVAAIVAVAGWVIARSGIALSRQTGLSETAIGGLLTAVATSLPELVTSIAAVRRGALTLAVGGVIGGNCFDTLFLAAADIAYRPGSLYHAMGPRQSFLIALTILLTGILLTGLLRREKSGIANIGFESFLILVLYGGAVAFMLSS